MELTIRITRQGKTMDEAKGADEVFLVHHGVYQEGTDITLECDEEGFLVISLDATMGASLVYTKGGKGTMHVPFGEKKICFDPNSFSGDIHLISVRQAHVWEIEGTRNLSLNPFDCHENTTFFPHAHANVETRGEASFEARNAIDGLFANSGHGKWPYSSWGINRNPKAALTIEFGRKVHITEVILTLRADYPHDAWWTEAKVTMDDGKDHILSLKKLTVGQHFNLEPTITTKLVLHDLIKADDPSPFPALTQIEVIGSET